MKIGGYNLVNKVRQGKKGGGVSIAIEDGIKYRRREDLELSNLTTVEHLVIEIRNNNDNIIVCSAYRAPNANTSQSVTDFDLICKNLVESHKHVVVAMDHNMNFPKFSSHNKTREFVESSINNDLYPSITKPTRVTHSTVTLIDNIFCSEILHRNMNSFVILDDTSDHYPCLCIMTNSAEGLKAPTTLYYRKFSEKNVKKLQDRLEQVSWNTELDSLSCEESFNYFHDRITEHMNITCPERKLIVCNKKEQQHPWITLGIQHSLRKQKKLTQQVKRNVGPGNENSYKNYRSCLQHIIRRAKQDYLLSKCNEYRNNTCKLWNLTNKVLRKTNDKCNIVESLTVDGIKVLESQEIANEFGKFFAEVGKSYANLIPKSDIDISDYIGKIENFQKSLFLTPITRVEIDRLIRTFAPKKSSGFDQISNDLIKQLGPTLVAPLEIIFNKSLTEGVFPSRMKYADITPLYKSKDRHEKSNYRPISLLLTLSKILEKCMYIWTYNFLDLNGLIYQSQYGFRSNHSCELAASELKGEIVKGHENKEHTIAIYLDLSKAFDTLDHEILLKKCARYGIRGKALD